MLTKWSSFGTSISKAAVLTKSGITIETFKRFRKYGCMSLPIQRTSLGLLRRIRRKHGWASSRCLLKRVQLRNQKVCWRREHKVGKMQLLKKLINLSGSRKMILSKSKLQAQQGHLSEYASKQMMFQSPFLKEERMKLKRLRTQTMNSAHPVRTRCKQSLARWPKSLKQAKRSVTPRTSQLKSTQIVGCLGAKP